MKMKMVITLAISLIGVMSCSKQGNQKTSPLKGKWLWVKSAGGVTGSNEILPQPGESRYLEFFNDFTYKLTQTSAVSSTYTNRYSILSVTDSSSGEQKPAVILVDETLRPQQPLIYIIGHDELQLKENCTGCYTHYYRAAN